VPRLENLEDRTLPSTLTVLNNHDSGPGSLRAAVTSAASGDTIQFSSSLQGQTITLTSGELAITRNLDIEGPGATNLSISGNSASRIFDIAGGTTVRLAGLTITQGRADHGGAILDEAGANVTLSQVTLSNNQATGLGGGGLFNDRGASLTVTGSSLTNNTATTALAFDPTTGGAGGGAIFNNFGARLSVTGSNLSGNQAITTEGFDAIGGAIYNLGGTATITDSTLAQNQASGGGSFSFIGGSVGGAVENSLGATLVVNHCSFTGNQVITADSTVLDAYFATGGAIDDDASSSADINNSSFTANNAIGGSGGQEGGGGALCNFDFSVGSTLDVTASTFTANQAIGGPGGGAGVGGAIDNGSTGTFRGDAFIGNRALGGNDGVVTDSSPVRGTGGGGAVFADTGPLSVDQCTFTGNQAIGGNRGSVSHGMSTFYSLDNGLGGGVAILGINLVLRRSTFADNLALGGSHSDARTRVQGVVGMGEGGGAAFTGVSTVSDSTFVHNQARGGNDNTGGSGVLEIGGGNGGAIANTAVQVAGVTLNATNLTLSQNEAIGGTGNSGGILTGDGLGGGLENDGGATATISNSTIANNQAIGGQGVAGGKGGDGLGGGIANILGSMLTVSNSTLDYNGAIGGNGGVGGNGLGGGIYNDGSTAFGVSSLTVTGSAITDNQAQGGQGDAPGDAGQGIGGGVYLAAGGIACEDALTVIAHNHASTSNDDVFGVLGIC
jgi:hypothetical protein